MTHLHVIDVDPRVDRPGARRLTNGSFTVGSFDWSPDGKSIAFDHRDRRIRRTAAPPTSRSSSRRRRHRVARRDAGRPRHEPAWSPDGTQIAFDARWPSPVLLHEQRASPSSAATAGVEPVTDAFDEDPASSTGRRPASTSSRPRARTWSHLYARPRDGGHRAACAAINGSAAASRFSRTARPSPSSRRSPTDFPDVYVAPVATMAARRS